MFNMEYTSMEKNGDVKGTGESVLNVVCIFIAAFITAFFVAIIGILLVRDDFADPYSSKQNGRRILKSDSIKLDKQKK